MDCSVARPLGNAVWFPCHCVAGLRERGDCPQPPAKAGMSLGSGHTARLLACLQGRPW